VSDRPATVGASLRARVRVHALCQDCHQDRELNLEALVTGGFADRPLSLLPLRCECGSRNYRVIISRRT
jgi:hypothetical protein